MYSVQEFVVHQDKNSGDDFISFHHLFPGQCMDSVWRNQIYLRLHSTAGGGLNMCHRGLLHESQLVGMW